MSNLSERIIAKLTELSPDEACDFFGINKLEIRKIIRGQKKPTVEMAEKLMMADALNRTVEKIETQDTETTEREKETGEIFSQINLLREKVRVSDEASFQEVLQAVIEGKWSRKMVLLMPMHREVSPHVLFNVAALIRKSPWLGFDYQTNTIIQRARNLLAQRFLNSEAEWSFWMDSDMIIPVNLAGFIGVKMKGEGRVPVRNADFLTPERLLSHGKTIVGAVYARRGKGDGLCIQPALHPRNEEDRAITAGLMNGPIDRLYEVSYCATGCLLVHRSVYEDIQSTHPELAPQKEGDPWDFFGHNVGVSGEDINFARLAKEAGHSSYLDCALFCGHLGTYCYFPGDT